jgi:hypothetical protein
VTAPGPLYPPFYPPAYPIVPVPAPVPEQLTANGVLLNNGLWSEVEGLQTLFVVPGLRGENSVVPGRHGVIQTPRKRYDATEVVIPMHVKGVNRGNGLMPPRAAARLLENVDHLLGAFHTETVTLAYRRDDATTRTVTAELAADPVVVVRERSVPPLARVTVALTLLDPFWTESQDVSQTITGVNGTTTALTAFQGSTAPITDAIIRFIGPISNPKLAIGERHVRYNGVIPAGRELVLECGHWRAHSGAGASWSPDVRQVYREPGPCWLEIPASAAAQAITFTHTGGGAASVEISGRRRFLSP